MILYIHGFGSSGQGGKSTESRAYFKSRNIPFIAPSLSYVPELAISTLEELIESYDDVTLIGSSLGGYYMMYLAEKYGVKAVLINPATHSVKTLERAVNLQGQAKNYYDESTFAWHNSHLDMLRKYEVSTTDKGRYMLLLQKGDDVLDKMVTFRVHLDDSDKDNGCLNVIPHTHTYGLLSSDEIHNITAKKASVCCEVKAGDIVLMRPHILHASSKCDEPNHRRIVHIEYSDYVLPSGLKWA